MVDDTRNPYVILGVPFGASESEARAGFARASRRLKSGAEHARPMEDLTWALHQIEQIIEDPALAFSVYRIPANPEAVNHSAEGVFSPQPEPLHRSTAPATDAELRGTATQSREGAAANRPRKPAYRLEATDSLRMRM